MSFFLFKTAQENVHLKEKVSLKTIQTKINALIEKTGSMTVWNDESSDVCHRTGNQHLP